MFFRGCLGYGFYFLFSFVCVAVIPLFMLLFSWTPPARRQRIVEGVFRAFCHFLSRTYLPSLGIYRIVEESGFEILDTLGPAIIVANHRSRMDAPFLLPVLKNSAPVIKSNYARIPFYATLVRHLNFVSVSANSLTSLFNSIQLCKQMLTLKKRLLIFPEGTRAAGCHTGEFKDLAFRLAIEADVPVLPIVVHTSLPFMAKVKGSVFPPFIFDVTIRALPPMRHTDAERPTHYAARVRKLIGAHLQQLDKGTPWEMPVFSPAPARQFQYVKGVAPTAASNAAVKDVS